MKYPSGRGGWLLLVLLMLLLILLLFLLTAGALSDMLKHGALRDRVFWEYPMFKAVAK